MYNLGIAPVMLFDPDMYPDTASGYGAEGQADATEQAMKWLPILLIGAAAMAFWAFRRA